MVDLGPRACLDHGPAGPCGPTGASAPGGRRDGHRAPGSPRVWQRTASRWGTLDSPLYRLSVGASVGRRVGPRETAVRDTPMGPPRLRGFVPSPRGGWWAGRASSDAGAHGSAVAGAPDALVSRSTLHLRRRQRLWYQRDGP